MKIVLVELAELLGGRLIKGEPTQLIQGFASLKEARGGDLTFYSDTRYRARLEHTKASAALIAPGLDTEGLPAPLALIEVANPSLAFEKVVDAYGFHPAPFKPGIHPRACIAEDITADLTQISVGANAVIESGAVIGNGVEIGAGCYVGKNVILGEGTRLFPNVTVQEACEIGRRVILHSGVVIGADGFGYEFEQGRHRKVRQAGIVQIDDDVEIGAGTTVDRARFGRTWIGQGTKIDNLVQIGHNVVIGRHCILVSGAAIAGSAVLEDYVVVAAQAGVAGHVCVGSGATLGARTGVTKDIPPGRVTYLGFPAVPAVEERRRLAGTSRMPQLLKRVRKLEERLGQQEAGSSWE